MSERIPEPIGPQLTKEMGVWHVSLVFPDRQTRDDFVKEAAHERALTDQERIELITADELPGGKSGEYDLWPRDGYDGQEPGRHLGMRVWNGSREAADKLMLFVMTRISQRTEVTERLLKESPR